MATSTTQEVSKVRVAELIKREEDRFRNARPRSHELWNRARQVLPRGVPSSFQDADPQPVFADHGEAFGDHGLLLHKNPLYRELIHVPLVLYWPQHLPAETRIRTPVSIVSLPATSLDPIDARMRRWHRAGIALP